MSTMRYTNQPRGFSTGSLPLDRKDQDGAMPMVQLGTWPGRELEQTSRKDGSPDLPKEHSEVLGDVPYGGDTPDTWRPKAEEAAAIYKDYYEEECRKIWEESERWRKEEP